MPCQVPTTRLPSQERPWLKYYSEEARSRTSIPEETVYERLLRAARGRESKIALTYYDCNTTFGQLLEEVEETAAAFETLGVKKGDMVAFCVMTCPEVVVSLYALNKLGAAIMLLDPRRGVEEVRSYTAMGKVRYMFVQDIFYPNLKTVLPELPMEKIIIAPLKRGAAAAAKMVMTWKFRKLKIDYTDRVISYDAFFNLGHGKKTTALRYEDFELAAVTFSGGTTGTPKGIMYSNMMLNAASENLRCLNPDDGEFRSLGIVPIFASYGLACQTHGPLGVGAKVILMVKPDLDDFCKLFKKYKPTNIVLVPGFYEKMVDTDIMKGVDMSFLLSAASGGDSMSPALEERANAFLKEHRAIYPHVAQGYGMSEMCSVETVCYGKAYKPGSVGIPMRYVNLCICRPGTTEELGYGEEGEICGSGPSSMMGYLANPEETEKTMLIHADGQKWIHSGDIGYIDEDGFLYFKGRIKRAIPRPDGHKVFPIQLESTVSKVNNVAECACVGVRDGNHQEGLMPVVAVRLLDASRREETMAAIGEALKKEIEYRSQPMDVYTVDELPHLGAGKLDYQKIADDYMKEHGIRP